MIVALSGVAKRLKDFVPHHLSVHAAAHVDQLALVDAFGSIPYYSEWRETRQEVYVYYHRSGKKRFNLEKIANKLNVGLLTLKGIHGIR